MEQKWVRPVFLFTVLAVWTVAMGTSLVRLQLPDPILWGVPTTLWLVMNPPALPSFKKKDTAEEKPGA